MQCLSGRGGESGGGAEMFLPLPAKRSVPTRSQSNERSEPAKKPCSQLNRSQNIHVTFPGRMHRTRSFAFVLDARPLRFSFFALDAHALSCYSFQERHCSDIREDAARNGEEIWKKSLFFLVLLSENIQGPTRRKMEVMTLLWGIEFERETYSRFVFQISTRTDASLIS